MNNRAPAILEAEDEYNARHDVLVAQLNLSRRRAWRLERALRGLLASQSLMVRAAAQRALEEESL